jgi:hypothetical protein
MLMREDCRACLGRPDEWAWESLIPAEGKDSHQATRKTAEGTTRIRWDADAGKLSGEPFVRCHVHHEGPQGRDGHKRVAEARGAADNAIDAHDDAWWAMDSGSDAMR